MTIFPSNAGQEKYREELGFRISIAVSSIQSKQAAATVVGVTPEQLNKWIRGQVKVPADALKALADASEVDFSWLVTGRGISPFVAHYPGEEPQPTSQAKEPVRPIDDWTMRRVAAIVTAVHGERNIPISPENVAVEAALLYNELILRASDLTDRDEVLAVLPQLRHLLNKRLEKDEAEPGTSKASA